MREELRVTIVATGLGLEKRKQQPLKVLKTGTGPASYEQLDTPTVIRNRRSERPMAAQPTLDYLDIPAFLRKQAD